MSLFNVFTKMCPFDVLKKNHQIVTEILTKKITSLISWHFVMGKTRIDSFWPKRH